MTHGKKIRVLIVDDSFFMRKLLREFLIEDYCIQVVGEAKNGSDAISQAIKLKPDVITMDFKMPGMNGLEASKTILKKSESKPAIIMISAFTTRDAEETLECLRAGAVDYIQKPSGEFSSNIDSIKDEIIVKIKAASYANVKIHNEIIPKNKKRVLPMNPVQIVVIGSSTGGPPIIENILEGLPGHLNVPVLVAQHMPEYFTNRFAERLNDICLLNVKEAENGDKIKKGMVYIAPGGKNMTVRRSQDGCFLDIADVEHPSDKMIPSIDMLMQSATKAYSGEVLAAELTGMGKDGLKGAEFVKKFGGHVMVQSPQTAVLDSMPKSVIDSDLADYILSPSQIAEKITELCINEK